MTFKKKIGYFLLFLLLFGIGYALNFAVRYAYVGTSYNAKMVCSCKFVAGRDIESIKKEELYAVSFSNIDIDEANSTVSANIYGLATAKAIFRPGLGCTLVNEMLEREIYLQPKPPTDTTKAQNLKIQVSTSINDELLTKTVNEAFEEKNPAEIMRTRAVVVLHNGNIIAEKYAPNFTENTPLIGWSMTKSVTSAMVGLLVKDKKLDIYKPAPIDEWKNDDRNKITIDHLLRMSSGLDFDENYTSPGDATTMLFRVKGAGAYAIKSKIKAEPDKIWSYSSGTSNILQELMRRQFNSHSEYLAFPHLRLFQKLGMKSAVLEPDASGTYVGSSFMFATARDWAKFGQLYLQDGVWKNERLLPEGWVKYSATETPKSDGDYAAHFWINHTDKDFPQDAFMALGFESQSVTIIPSKQLVIVRLGCTPKDNFDLNGFVKKIVKLI